MVYTLRFLSLKCSLFHNSNLFGSCIIHILYTECAKIKKIIPAPKGEAPTQPSVLPNTLSPNVCAVKHPHKHMYYRNVSRLIFIPI